MSFGGTKDGVPPPKKMLDTLERLEFASIQEVAERRSFFNAAKRGLKSSSE